MRLNATKVHPQMTMSIGRLLVWFSCGAASAVASKIATQSADLPIEVLYCNTLKYEHEDNARFMREVSEWIGHPIKTLNHDKFTDIMDVFRKERFLNGIHGAPCTRALKRDVRLKYQDPSDVHVFGYTVDEGKRIAEFERSNNDIWISWVLRDAGITKQDCYRILQEAGIKLPAMYLMGYGHNNCIGCVKGGAGYWNKIRVDFPESFNRMASLEREIGASVINGKFLDDLKPGTGRYKPENIECGTGCHTRQHLTNQ